MPDHSFGTSYKPLVVSIARDIVINTTVPVACYYFSKAFISPSELIALAVATAFPILKSVRDVVRSGTPDPVAVVVLLGIVASIIALFFGGSPKLLLIRESFFTGALGFICLLSLLPVFPRPVMFYFGRFFVTENDPERIKVYEQRWQIPVVRRGHKFITAIWGFVYVGEFILRVAIVYTLPTPVVLAVSPFLVGVATIIAVIWTFRYAHVLRMKAEQAEGRHLSKQPQGRSFPGGE